jgi:hypothetical protein
MNRILRRPMFRTGGSAEGITSGLDYPKLNASRPGYNRGRVVNPGGYAGDPIEERFLKRRDLLRKYQSPRPSGMSDFMVQFGLDLASRPPQGNILSTAAASAKDPFSQYTARKEAYRTSDDKLSAALLGDVMELASEEERARIKAEGEMGTGGKQFEYKGKMEDYQRLIEQQRDLEKQLQEEESIQSIEGVPDHIGPQKDQNKIDSINKKLEDNAKLQALFADKEEDEVRKAILKGIANGIFTFEDLIVYDETGVPPKGGTWEGAQGGRAGYANAGAVMPAVASASGNMDQGPKQDSPVQNLSYEELRSRLPASVTDDIIQLIANSQEALVDFANIQTQRDIKSFNQKYQVELVLPQEA